MVGLAKRLEGRPFHLIATHCQNNPKEEVVAYLESKELRPSTPNFTVTSFGGHPSVKGNGYVPYYMVFDHRGRLVQHHMCGSFHGGDGLKMIEWVDKLLPPAPAIYLGEEPFTEVPALAEQVRRKHGLAAVVKKIQIRLAGGAGGKEQKELQRLFVAVEKYRDAALTRAGELMARTPSDVLEKLEGLWKELKGTSLAVAVKKRIAELSGSDVLKRSLKVEKGLAKIEKGLDRLNPCKACKRRGMKKAKLTCSACRGQSRGSIAGAAKKLEALLKGNEDLPIAARVKELLGTVK
ncbi:MAG: hypothetical protein ACYTDY_03515 [Planctomycetota bacterium]